MAKAKICLILMLMSLFLLVVENRQFKPPKISGRENFVGAVYEHLPILALPVCYEKGKFI